MARKLTGKPVGRPEKDIDWTLFEQLCAIQCTQSEIASMMKIHIDTLRDRAAAKYGDEYSNIYKKLCETGKCSLRRNQFVLSKTNASLAIWLGKQWLGQRDYDDVQKDKELERQMRLEEYKNTLRSQDAKDVSEQTVNSFNALMSQLDNLQLARKIAESKSNSE